MCYCCFDFFSFFFNATATTEIYTLSLHDALPIWACQGCRRSPRTGTAPRPGVLRVPHRPAGTDRKSTRLNSSHVSISYAVFCLKKKKKKHTLVRHKQSSRNRHAAARTDDQKRPCC